jgi:hypothetical protein
MVIACCSRRAVVSAGCSRNTNTLSLTLSLTSFAPTLEKKTVYNTDGTVIKSATVATEERAFYRRFVGCVDTSAQAWSAEYFRGQSSSTPDVRATDLLQQCNRPNGWLPNTPLKETISHFYVEQEHGRQLNQLGRGSFGDDSGADFNNIEFFQIDADGSSSLIEDWIYDHLVGVPILHNMAVQRVRYSTGKNVKTVAQSLVGGGGCTQKFRSKYVIVTPSIDVVRKQITFKPPQPVQTALDKHPIKINTVRGAIVGLTFYETSGI